MLFVRKDIPSNLQAIQEKPAESFYVEFNLPNTNLVNICYEITKNSIGNHLGIITGSLDLLSFDYRKKMFLGDSNVTDDRYHIKSFCENYDLKNLRQPTYYKNPSNSECIDLILTNVPRNFQSTCEEI